MSYCGWDNNEEQKYYHDEIWGRPVHDDLKHFENIIYEVFQCGLSWWLVYAKRGLLEKLFDGFDFEKISKYTQTDIERIFSSEGMIKSKNKINAVINNANKFIEIRNEFGSFDNYLWSYTGNKTLIYEKHKDGYIPASNGLSLKISKDLKKRGFKYLGSIIVYSHMQACGLILDHSADCHCFKEIVESHPTKNKQRYLEKDVIYYK